MHTERAIIEKVLSCIEKEKLIQHVTDLVNIPSPAGREGEVGEYIFGWLKGHGLKTVRGNRGDDSRQKIGGSCPSGCHQPWHRITATAISSPPGVMHLLEQIVEKNPVAKVAPVEQFSILPL